MDSAESAIAVVIPTFQRRDLLAATLDSLAALDPAPAEVVVVCDGSTDGTDELVRRQGIQLLHTDRRGAAGARNAGWRATTSPVVVFIDDDCVAEPGWLGALAEPFRDQRIGVVQGRTLPARPPGPDERTIHVESEYGLYESCNIAYRRSALEQVGGFDERFGRIFGGRPFGEDTDLAWRVRRAGWSSAFAEHAVVRHHVFPGRFVDSLREDWRRGRFPFLVREIPELRSVLPGRGWFLRRHSAWAQLALVAGTALAVPRVRLLAPALALPYARWLARHHRHDAARQAARDAVTSVALLAGSARHRSLLL